MRDQIPENTTEDNPQSGGCAESYLIVHLHPTDAAHSFLFTRRDSDTIYYTEKLGLETLLKFVQA